MFEKLTPRTPLPSLNALRAFEAMARTGSATLAGAELSVTHSAISRQVKVLEEQLGQALFEGPRHALKLTAAGQALLPELSASFDRLAHAVSKVRSEAQDLYVAVNASLSVKWLIPRLPDFNRQHPDIHLHLVELPPHATQLRGADILIRLLDEAQIKTLGATPLIANWLGPVMAPIKDVDDLAQACLLAPRLIPRTHQGGWAAWASQEGISLPRVLERPVAHLHFALDAALSGWGAAVLPWVLTASAVREGHLIAPFGFTKDTAAVCALAGSGPDTRARRRFMDWLKAQAADFPQPFLSSAP